MPPRIAFWTSSFEPHLEAVASEVALLRRRFPASVAWGLSRRHWVLLSPARGFCLHPRLHLLFRAATRVLGPLFELNHVFGSLGDWFYLRRLCRPTLLTVATAEPPVARRLLQRVDRFAVECPAGRDRLEGLGIDRRRVRLIFPPVDLAAFTPAPPPDGPFTVLFASSPEEEGWLDARGVPPLLEAAALRPAMRFRLLWRPWGNALARVRAWVAERGLANVEVAAGRCADMAAEYRRAHVTVAPFTDPGRCKPAPNSVVEGLACGRPALVSDRVGLAEVVAEGRAGLVCPPTGAALAERLDHLHADWDGFARRAREAAERWFGVEQFLDGYCRLYHELAPGR